VTGPAAEVLAVGLPLAVLANSASLLLPVSNLTNLLAVAASGVSFGRFAAMMALPWLVSIAIEYAVLRRVFRADLAASCPVLLVWPGDAPAVDSLPPPPRPGAVPPPPPPHGP
jgi:arsenical pump membrane protein